jgi:hypothetical protein
MGAAVWMLIEVNSQQHTRCSKATVGLWLPTCSSTSLCSSRQHLCNVKLYDWLLHTACKLGIGFNKNPTHSSKEL